MDETIIYMPDSKVSKKTHLYFFRFSFIIIIQEQRGLVSLTNFKVNFLVYTKLNLAELHYPI